MNKVVLLGNLGADPEVRHTQSGDTVMNLRLATSERTKDGDEWRDFPEWHSVVVFGRRAESLSGVITKGSKVCVSGRLRTSSYDGRDGVKRYRTEVIADQVELAGGGRPDTAADTEAPPESDPPF